MELGTHDALLEHLLAPVRALCEHSPTTLGVAAAMMPHGTTIGAFLIENGQKAIAFSDGKVSMGNKPVQMDYRKILTIDHHSRMLISGSLSLGLRYAKALRSWLGYLEDISDQYITARAKVGVLSRTLMQGLGLANAGLICAPIFVTYDLKEKKRARIFLLSPDGSEIERKSSVGFAMSGSGEGVGVLCFKGWHIEMTEAEGVAFANELTKLVPEIDSFSGGKTSIDVIGPDGARTVQQENGL